MNNSSLSLLMHQRSTNRRSSADYSFLIQTQGLGSIAAQRASKVFPRESPDGDDKKVSPLQKNKLTIYQAAIIYEWLIV